MRPLSLKVDSKRLPVSTQGEYLQYAESVHNISTILWSPSPRAGGNLFASSSENNAMWRLNSSGRVTSVFPCSNSYLWAISTAVWVRLTSTGPPLKGVTPNHGLHLVHSRIRSSFVDDLSLIQVFACWRVPNSKVSIWTFWPSRVPFSQSILGLKALNHGYPKRSQSRPRLVTKNRCRSFLLPLVTSKLQAWVIVPCRLRVPSTLNAWRE